MGKNGVGEPGRAPKPQRDHAVQPDEDWLVLIVDQHHHSCCKCQRIHDFLKASRGIEITGEIILGCFCAHILLRHRGNLIRPGMEKGGSVQFFF